MRKFHFRPGRNAALALFMGALAILCAAIWWRSGGWLPLGGFLLFGFAAAKGATDAMSSEPALAFGDEGLRVRTSSGVQKVAWSEVQGISLEVFTIRYWGIIPLAKQENLVIRCDGGLFGTRRLRLAMATMELPVGGAQGLLALLHAAHVAAVGEAGVAMAGAGEHGWGVAPASKPQEEAGTSFDADAAIARYMARKASEGQPAEPVCDAERCRSPLPRCRPALDLAARDFSPAAPAHATR